jgi:phosphopantetheinyl transferase (holo-ACP synthase)
MCILQVIKKMYGLFGRERIILSPEVNTRFFQEKEKKWRVLFQQQQQHIQIQLIAELFALKDKPRKAVGLGNGMFFKLFMVINLYPPGYLPGQELAPS